MIRAESPAALDPADREKVQDCVQRIVNSEPFRRAPNLRNLLEYLVVKSTEGHGEQLKESVIAMEVFGRRSNFDGRLDNIVRVQAHRLRKLLDAYYADAGKDEKLRIAVPRGGYVPQVLTAEVEFISPAEPLPEPQAADEAVAFPSPAALPAPAALPVNTKAPAVVSRPNWKRVSALAGMFAAGVLTASLFMIWFTWKREPHADAAIAEIWQSFFEPGVRPIVSYTNPVFLRVGRSQTYLNYKGSLSAPPGTQMNISNTDPGLDSQYLLGTQPLFFSDGWTGTGEVLAVNRLTELAFQFHDRISVVPSRALAVNEMRSSNVLFLGSPWMNGVLAQVGNESTPIYNTNDGRIVVRESPQSTSTIYQNLKDPVTGEIKASYALFSVLPGMELSRRVVSSAGLGTWATWGAIDFLTTPAGARQLGRALREVNHGRLPNFYQAVIRSELIKGSVSNQSLIAVRVAEPRREGK